MSKMVDYLPAMSMEPVLSKEAVQLPVQLHREQLSVVDTRWVD